MPDLDRRALLALAAGAPAVAAAAPATAAAASIFQPKPLGIDPAHVPGLSARLVTSHYEVNYQNAVRKLNAIQQSMSALDPAQAAGFTISGLKREELAAWNSTILHELYFAGLGTAKPAPTGALAQAIERDFGSHARWAAQFSAGAKALGGGSGWMVLTWTDGWSTSGPLTTPCRWRAARPCWPWICTSTPTTWTTAPARRPMSTPT
jgi:Fe-Mn family superoxide dismutase